VLKLALIFRYTRNNYLDFISGFAARFFAPNNIFTHGIKRNFIALRQDKLLKADTL